MIGLIKNQRLDCPELKRAVLNPKLNGRGVMVKITEKGLYECQKLCIIMAKEMFDMQQEERSFDRYRKQLSLNPLVDFTEPSYGIIGGDRLELRVPKSWSYFKCKLNDYNKLINGLKRVYFEENGFILDGTPYDNKVNLLKMSQNGKCVSCGVLFVEVVYEIEKKKKVIEIKADLHHALIHDTAIDRKRYPQIIDSIINQYMLCFNCNRNTSRSWGICNDYDFLDSIEKILKSKPNLSKFLNDPPLTGFAYKVVDKIKRFDLMKFKEKKKLVNYLIGLVDFTFKEKKRG